MVESEGEGWSLEGLCSHGAMAELLLRACAGKQLRPLKGAPSLSDL